MKKKKKATIYGNGYGDGGLISVIAERFPFYKNHDFASISVNGGKWRAAERALRSQFTWFTWPVHITIQFTSTLK
jgi:hypothetical protein